MSPKHLALFTILVFATAMVHAASDDETSIKVTGKKEVVFPVNNNQCAADDLADNSLRVFRRNDGAIIGFATEYNARPFVIDANGKFRRECTLSYKSRLDADPESFDDRIWISATWTNDGKTVAALGHNEYHGEKHPGHCASGEHSECWYNAVVLLRSDDGGRTFSKIPGSQIAAAKFNYQTYQASESLHDRPRGFFEPTNIVEHQGYYYTLIFTSGGQDQAAGTCVFRTRELLKPTAWEYWVGDGFSSSRGNRPCKPIVGQRGRFGSLVKDRRSGVFVATVGIQNNEYPGGMIGFTTSRDLVSWTPLTPIMTAPMYWSQNCMDKARYWFPTLLDLTAPDRNFSEIDDRPFLYLTEMNVRNCKGLMERRLIRYSVSIKGGHR